MKNMYKEKAKSGINPLFATAMWLAGTYIFILLWGIAQILFEFQFETLKHIICLLGTAVFAWFLISKLLTQYEFEVSGGKLSISRLLGKRSSEVRTVAADNICAMCESKDKYKQYDVKKLKSFTLPAQVGKTVYIVYKRNDELWAIKLKCSKELTAALKKGNKEK